MLSRLISLLSRIPAVKWAFNRLRPLPHSGGIDVAQIATDEQPEVIAEATPAVDADISAEPLQCGGDIEVAAPTIEDDTEAAVVAENPSATPIDLGVGDNSSPETPAEIETVIVEEVSLSADEVESEPVDAPERVGSDVRAGPLTDVAPEVMEEAPVSSIEVEAIIAAEPVIEDEPAAVVSGETEPVAAAETPAVAVDTEIAAPDAAAHVAPAPAKPAPKSPPKLRAKPVEPTDRAALIRQRWAETGIRMWNPRLHGTGDATLNIQGRIGLLPPEPGETMPRYDKLEFKLLGGQIVCEGVIVEAPVHAGQRNFTRLAEPRGTERTREPVRERQAALA
ncbi:hypothetical protein [Bradyrhizobium sp. BR13661]|uniref:hypothetical protein n=1 Tax=Bradyrhizobium sp. BR13661 TaxID=2940622 RepID=UPI00247499FA|nr:hypothetical protein [Bradyrhizobium sp. BR13661]MDH6260380.1 hypothetical protein [Bradyrhizobium sp. BR13661]